MGSITSRALNSALAGAALMTGALALPGVAVAQAPEIVTGRSALIDTFEKMKKDKWEVSAYGTGDEGGLFAVMTQRDSTNAKIIDVTKTGIKTLFEGRLVYFRDNQRLTIPVSGQVMEKKAPAPAHKGNSGANICMPSEVAMASISEVSGTTPVMALVSPDEQKLATIFAGMTQGWMLLTSGQADKISCIAADGNNLRFNKKIPLPQTYTPG